MQRLIRARIEVDDRQAPERQPGLLIGPHALAVGAAVRHRARHGEKSGRIDSPVDDSADSAHTTSISAASSRP